MISLITIFLFYLLSAYPTFINASEVNNIDSHKSIPLFNGQPVIFMDEKMQNNSGLKILKTKASLFNPEMIAYGKGISLTPLLTIRKNYLSTIAQQNELKVRLNQAEKNISRLQNLHKIEVVSTKKLQKKRSQWHSEKAIYDKNIYKIQSILNNSKLHWGELLTNWVINKHSPQLDKLMSGEFILLQITVPTSQTLPSDIKTVFISPNGTRSTAVSASFVSILPQVDDFSQGTQYIFLSNTTKVKVGMNFTAWIPHQKHAQKGIIIPESSLAWHLEQAFVFIQIDEEHFVHREISKPIKTINGYYIGKQIAEGENLVTTGTSMLLSHEFKSQIPHEDNDDDD
ncbi:MAG: hypothetical protein KAH20_02075 [Methylococcales bacterium]|nr:hypothetical protein [Methylococcales bacterium]